MDHEQYLRWKEENTNKCIICGMPKLTISKHCKRCSGFLVHNHDYTGELPEKYLGRISVKPLRARLADQQKYLIIRNKLLDIVGRSCKRCRKDDIRCIQVDHVNGGGKKESTKKFGSTFLMYKFYIGDPSLARELLQTLCANCNLTKRHENQEFRYSTNNSAHSTRRKKLLEIVGKKCKTCGVDDHRLLMVTHINGGIVQKVAIMGQSGMYNHYIRNPDLARLELMTLCANCNSIYRYEKKRDESLGLI